MSFRYYRYEDGGLTARVLVTRPSESYRMDVWSSDAAAFSAVPGLDQWFTSILKSIRDTGRACFVHNVSLTHPPQSFFLPPEHGHD